MLRCALLRAAPAGCRSALGAPQSAVAGGGGTGEGATGGVAPKDHLFCLAVRHSACRSLQRCPPGYDAKRRVRGCFHVGPSTREAVSLPPTWRSCPPWVFWRFLSHDTRPAVGPQESWTLSGCWAGVLFSVPPLLPASLPFPFHPAAPDDPWQGMVHTRELPCTPHRIFSLCMGHGFLYSAHMCSINR